MLEERDKREDCENTGSGWYVSINISGGLILLIIAVVVIAKLL